MATDQRSWLLGYYLLVSVLGRFVSVAYAADQKLFFPNDDDGIAPFSSSSTFEGRVKIAELGHNVVLECEAVGKPEPVIYWLRDENRINQGDVSNTFYDAAGAIGLGSTKSRLFIDCVTNSDAGVYTCVAQTPSKLITQSTTLVVSTQSALPSSQLCISKVPLLTSSLEPARIFMWTSMRLEVEGVDVELYCRARGSPAPAVTWRDPRGQLIALNDDKYRIMGNGDLVIRNLNWGRNMGLYSCSVQNSYGSDEVDTFLYPTTP